ncbi:MAG: ATP-binding protein [Anaerolineae bacterium]|nr:ATP-binding protein [Anaerolineae bacterium]
MDQFDIARSRELLPQFEFNDLFVDGLGWNNAPFHQPLTLTVNEMAYTCQPIAELSGMLVFEVLAEDGQIPDSQTRMAVYREISQSYHENLLIFVDEVRTHSVWYWVKREGGKLHPRTHYYDRWQDPDFHLGKISGLFVAMSELDPQGRIEITRVVQRVQGALDIERITKRFYGEFKQVHDRFMAYLEPSIPDEKDRRWYTSALLNRLMFIYFLQRQRLIDNGATGYLHDKLQVRDWQDRYYLDFLHPLFFEGFALPESRRSDQANAVLGVIPYLNGGLFLHHSVEIKYQGRIQIPDQAFRELFTLLDGYTWHLDDRPGRDNREINPDVLGYIFEKYINQKAFGAYYTRPEITEYLCEQTIERLVVEKMREIDEHDLGVLPPLQYEDVHELLRKMDGQRALILLRDILPNLSLLDPACGSGAFLVAALKTLTGIYQSVLGRAEYLDYVALRQYVQQELQGHPNKNYYIRKKIISHNLFGVDIMDEAVEIARLRLFLALVATIRRPEDLEPLPNIDFNILPGNSLIGLLRVNEADYQRYFQSDLFSGPVVTYRQMVEAKERLVKNYRLASTLTADVEELRKDIEDHRRKAQITLNRMLLDEFNRLNIKYEQATWDDEANKPGKPQKRPLTLADIGQLQPFHWGYEFDAVMNERGGFDAIITNPPWEVFQTDEKEFFSEYSDVIHKKKMNILDFTEKKNELLQDLEIREAWLEYSSRFAYQSAYMKNASQYENQTSMVDGKKVPGKVNLYKVFLEQCFNLLKTGGYCGIIVPTSVYVDGDKMQIREMLFSMNQVINLFSLSNERFIFEGVHHAMKFVLLTFEKGGPTDSFWAAFRINPRVAIKPQNLESFLLDQNEHVSIPISLIRRLSPDYLSLVEFQSSTDISIANKITEQPQLGDSLVGVWNIQLTTEFDKTATKALFEINPSKETFPLMSGSTIHQFTHQFSPPEYYINSVEGKRRLKGKMGNTDGRFACENYRLIQRRVSGQVNERTLICSIIPKCCFCDNSVNYLIPGTYSQSELMFLTALLNSYIADYQVRQRMNSNITIGLIYQLAVPRLTSENPSFQPIVTRVTKLICTTPEFDDLAAEVGLSSHANGVTDPAQRAQLRAELDGLIAHVYGLTEDEFSHILSTFPLVATEVKEAALREYQRFAPQRDLLSGAWQPPTPLVITEGKTDWMHIKAAWERMQAEGHFSKLTLEVQEYDDNTQMGDAELLRMCQQYAKTQQIRPHIFIFDRDNRSILNQITTPGSDYKDWGNNVYSVALPIPAHRMAQPEISIELYYTDDAIKQPDSQGRRLFLSDEFVDRTGFHVSEDLHCTDRNKYGRSGVIIDHDVFRVRDPQNVAMTKNDFAQHVLNGDAGFDGFNISAFVELFAVVEQLILTQMPMIA